jgi:hypothetical protein
LNARLISAYNSLTLQVFSSAERKRCFAGFCKIGGMAGWGALLAIATRGMGV